MEREKMRRDPTSKRNFVFYVPLAWEGRLEDLNLALIQFCAVHDLLYSVIEEMRHLRDNVYL
jgi:hypothetical protein